MDRETFVRPTGEIGEAHAPAMLHDGSMRVHVIGGPGTGKTTAGRAIGIALEVPLVELDRAIAYKAPNAAEDAPFSAWERASWHDRLDAATALAHEASWVSEGIYAGWTEPLVARADVIIWLDLPGWQAAVGVVRRQWRRTRAQHGDPDRYQWLDALRLVRRAAIGYRYGRRATVDELVERDGANSASTTAAFLAPHAVRVTHCRSRAAARQAIEALTEGRRPAT